MQSRKGSDAWWINHSQSYLAHARGWFHIYNYKQYIHIHIIWVGYTYRGNIDSTPTPATSLLILNVVLSPALRLAITIPFIIETRLLFSGTSCQIRHNNNQKLILLLVNKNQVKNKYKLIFKNKHSYHFELHNITGLYIR